MNTFDPAGMIAAHTDELKKGETLTNMLDYIKFDGEGFGIFEVKGRITGSTRTVTEFDMQFNARGHKSPVTIGLGNWAGLDTRKMAEEGGTKHYYDLIFTQCSSDVHSQFMSLARWNMTSCDNPLHNFHLLPAFGERRINPFLPLTACVLGKEICGRIFKYLDVDAECVKILENLLESISEEVLNKTALADGSPPETGKTS